MSQASAPGISEVARHQAMLDAVAGNPHPYPEGQFAGRGIVFCGGGDVHFPCAWVSISMLRRLGCGLPIELWYRGPREMTAEAIALLEPLGVTCVDAYAMARKHPFRRLDGWELKPFAIAFSSFEEVLYLDADNVAVRDPAFLFDCPAYTSERAVFWPDRYAGPGTGEEWLKREIWGICRVPYRLEPEIEAGQLLIHKRCCWFPLQLALHLNEHSDFYYRYFYGDKDTFHLAWRRAEANYALAPHPPKNLGRSEAIVQFHFDASVLFQHRNRDKWSLLRANHLLPGFRLERECFDCLKELRSQWSPPMRRFPEELSGRERTFYNRICQARFFDYVLEGHGSRPVELRADFMIGAGAGVLETGWMIEDDKDGDPVLTIRNENGPICFLRNPDGGVWRGRWLVYDRIRVELRPRN